MFRRRCLWCCSTPKILDELSDHLYQSRYKNKIHSSILCQWKLAAWVLEKKLFTTSLPTPALTVDGPPLVHHWPHRTSAALFLTFRRWFCQHLCLCSHVSNAPPSPNESRCSDWELHILAIRFYAIVGSTPFVGKLTFWPVDARVCCQMSDSESVLY